MPREFRNEDSVVLRFGGGINSRASEDQINPMECSSGENFQLDPGNTEFRPRAPFDLIGQVPNGAEVRGFATLLDTSADASMLVQAGNTVYEWDGVTTFTSVGTVNANAKLRGTVDAQWPLADKVIITDLNLAEEVHEWNGTTFQEVAFTTDGSTAFGTFRAKYCLVDDERALYANIHDNGTNSPHLLVSSFLSDFTILSTSTRPDADNGASDAWFLPMPQLRPINGIAQVFGVVAISQEQGSMEKLTGDDATDYALAKLGGRTGASGSESVVATENDVVVGRPGRVESVLATDKFGDVEQDDISFKIANSIESYGSWSLYYNPRLYRLYAFPVGVSEVWVAQTNMLTGELSPWMKWTTLHVFAFQPTAAQICYDPSDGLEYLFMGDASGNVYRMEGTGSGDGGSADIVSKRRSYQFAAPLDAKVSRLEGWVKSRRRFANTLAIRYRFAGEHVHDVSKEISLPAVTFAPVYNGSGAAIAYYNGDSHYGIPFENRFIRNLWASSGSSNELEIELEISGSNSFSIAEFGTRFNFSS